MLGRFRGLDGPIFIFHTFVYQVDLCQQFGLH